MAPKVSSGGRIPRAFLDTNILAYSDDSRDRAKQRKALELIKEHLRQRSGVVSLQVLQEYFVTVTGKLRIDAALAKRRVEVFAKLYVAEPAVTDILAAIDLHRLHRLSFWDSLVIRMAKQTSCSVLLSEDMQHGQVIEGVRVINPFL